jgi:hypothetical protein
VFAIGYPSIAPTTRRLSPAPPPFRRTIVAFRLRSRRYLLAVASMPRISPTTTSSGQLMTGSTPERLTPEGRELRPSRERQHRQGFERLREAGELIHVTVALEQAFDARNALYEAPESRIGPGAGLSRPLRPFAGEEPASRLDPEVARPRTPSGGPDEGSRSRQPLLLTQGGFPRRAHYKRNSSGCCVNSVSSRPFRIVFTTSGMPICRLRSNSPAPT